MPIYNNYSRSTYTRDVRDAARTLSRYRRSPEMITIMVIGRKGSGKSTYLQSFCDTFIKARLRSESLDDTPILSKEDIDSNIEKSPPLKRGSLSSSASAPKRDLHYLFDTTAPTTVMSARTLLVKDQATGNKRHIKLIDTPGLEPENPQQASLIVQQAIDHIEHQYARHLREELKVRRQRHIPIQMVHVVLYFLAPPVQNRETPAYGPRAQRFRSPTDIITEMDLQAMSTLSKRANVIPVLGKADLLTLAERQTVQNGRLFADLSRMYPDLKLYNFNVTPEIEEPETPGGMLRPMDPAIPGRSGSTGENGATDNDDDNDDEDLGSGDAAMRRSARVSLLDAAQAADMPASSIQHALLRQAPFLVVGSEHVAEYQNAIADMIHYDNPELELSFMERERIDPSSGSPHGGSPGHSGGDMSGEGERSASSSSSEGSSRVVRSRNNSDSSFHSHGSSSRRVIPDRPPVLPSIEGLSSDGLMKRKSVVSNRSRRYSLRRAPPTSFAAAAAAANPARRYIGRSGHAGWRPRSRFLPETEVPDLMSLKGPTMAIERGGYREQIFLGRQFAWGELHLMNPEHSDFALLRTLLLDSHLQSLRDWTLEFHYENYRTTIMCQNPQIHSNPAAAALAELEAQAKERKRREEQQRKYAGIIPCADPANGSNVSGTDSEAEANQRVFAALETGSDSPPTSASESSSSMIAPGVRDTFNHQLNQHYNLKHKYKRYHPVRASPPNQAQDLQITAVPVDNSPSSSDFDKSGLVPPPSQPQTQRSYEKLKSKKILESLSGTLLKHRNKSSKHNRVHVGGSSGSSGGGNGQIQRVY